MPERNHSAYDAPSSVFWTTVQHSSSAGLVTDFSYNCKEQNSKTFHYAMLTTDQDSLYLFSSDCIS